MDWPLTAVDRQPAFRPPFCPRRHCREHRRASPDGYRATLHGHYTDRRGRVHPRFRCPACRSTFSRRAFSPRYYLKRPELLPRIAVGLVEGAGHRQIARTIDCAPSTVTRMAARIGRHALLLSLEALERLGAIVEPVVLDHFEAFEFSQDLPFGAATAIGADSWFVYAVDPAPHRRAGAMSPVQRQRAASRPVRDALGGYRASTRRVLDRVLPLARGRLRLVTDGHPAYRAAVAGRPVDHVARCNPPRGPKGSARSAEAVRRDRALFPVDNLHRLLRHSQTAHHRETQAFGRRLNALLERMWLFAVWRNFVKRRSERLKRSPTPAMTLGLTDRRWNWRHVFARRRFPDRLRTTAMDRLVYRRGLITPVLPINATHDLKLAY